MLNQGCSTFFFPGPRMPVACVARVRKAADEISQDTLISLRVKKINELVLPNNKLVKYYADLVTITCWLKTATFQT